MGHRNQTRFFKFHNEKETEKFIQLYADLFTPYKERVSAYMREHYKYDISDFARGFERDIYNMRNVMAVNLTPENLEIILGSGAFRKEKLKRNCSVYCMQ